MDPIEQRVRESLRARAEDAEPTPQLYRGVQDRIAKRRRAKLLAWVPAGAAALGVAVAVPMVLTSDPGVPNIEDYADEQPHVTSATSPDRAVIVDDQGEVSLLDLTDGSTVGTDVTLPGAVALDVPASDDAESPRWLAGTIEDGRPTFRIAEPDGSSRRYTPPTWDPMSGAAISDGGDWVAYLATPPEADGLVLTAVETATFGDQLAEPTTVTLGNVGESAQVLDWAGSTDGSTRRPSEILVRTDGGMLASFPVMVTADGSLTTAGDAVTVEDGADVLAASLTHLDVEQPEQPASSRYQLEQSGDRWVVRLIGEATGEIDVTPLVGGSGAGALWMDAWGDATLLGDIAAGRTWLLTHDGDGDFGEPVALPEGTVRAALVGKADVVAAPEETEEPAPADDSGDEEEAPAEEPSEPSAEVGLGDGMVVADDRTVTLVRPDGSTQELVTFSVEGESTVVAVAVRPGSTAEDLTVAITTRAEGTFDVRWLRVVGGTVDDTTDPDFPAPPIERDGEVVFASPDLQDGGASAAVWSPDGDLLAVVSRPEPGAAAQVRTIGWEEDGPSADPDLAASFELDTDRPLRARQWVWTDDADGVAREGELLLVDELAREAFAVRLDRQGDGAPAMPADNPLEPIEGEGVLDVADLDRDGTVDAVLRIGDPVPVLELRDGVLGFEDAPASVPLEFTGPREANFLAGSGELILIVLDPARPVLADPSTGGLRALPLDAEVVSADLIR